MRALPAFRVDHGLSELVHTDSPVPNNACYRHTQDTRQLHHVQAVPTCLRLVNHCQNKELWNFEVQSLCDKSQAARKSCCVHDQEKCVGLGLTRKLSGQHIVHDSFSFALRFERISPRKIQQYDLPPIDLESPFSSLHRHPGEITHPCASARKSVKKGRLPRIGCPKEGDSNWLRRFHCCWMGAHGPSSGIE